MTSAPTLPDRRLTHRRVSLPAAVLAALLTAGIALLVQHSVSQPSSTVEGSGLAATKVRVTPRFDAIELAGSNEVAVRLGPRQAVVVHADSNLLGRITTAVRNGRLIVDQTPGTFSPKTPMRVDVTVRSLREVILSGSGIVSATGIAARALKVSLSGSGVLRLAGTADSADVTVAGSGDAQLDQLVAQRVRAVVAGSGRILITAVQRLDAHVPGTGAIVYLGNPPSVSTDVTGVGSITPAG